MKTASSKPAEARPVSFDLGKVVGTPGALQFLADNGLTPFHFIERHTQNDWGRLPAEDAAANDAAMMTGGCLLSSYPVGDGRIWIITEGDRSATTVLLPSEY